MNRARAKQIRRLERAVRYINCTIDGILKSAARQPNRRHSGGTVQDSDRPPRRAERILDQLRAGVPPVEIDFTPPPQE